MRFLFIHSDNIPLLKYRSMRKRDFLESLGSMDDYSIIKWVQFESSCVLS